MSNYPYHLLWFLGNSMRERVGFICWLMVSCPTSTLAGSVVGNNEFSSHFATVLQQLGMTQWVTLLSSKDPDCPAVCYPSSRRLNRQGRSPASENLRDDPACMSLWLSHRCAGHSWHLGTKDHIISQIVGQRRMSWVLQFPLIFRHLIVSMFNCNFPLAGVRNFTAVKQLSQKVFKKLNEVYLLMSSPLWLRVSNRTHLFIKRRTPSSGFLWGSDTCWCRIVSLIVSNMFLMIEWRYGVWFSWDCDWLLSTLIKDCVRKHLTFQHDFFTKTA